MTNQVITEANGGVWSFAKTDSPYDSARVGRWHDLQFLVEGSGTSLAIGRAGVFAGAGLSSANTPAALFAAPTGSGLNFTVTAGSAVVERGTYSGNTWSTFTPSGTGPYLTHLRSTANLAANTASPSSTRIDRVDLQIMDGPGQGDNSGTSLAQVIYNAGTAGSGVAPNGPANSIPIATITIPANTTTLTGGMFADMRRSAGLRGGVRVMLPGDSLSDNGFVHGELRDTSMVPGATPRIDRWSSVSATWNRIIDLTNPQIGEALLLAAVTSTASAWAVPSAWTGPGQGLVFGAPASGIVRLDYSTRMHSANGGSFQQMAPVVLTGSSIGSGSVVQAATNDYSCQILSSSVSDFTSTSWLVLTGLTPGASYNVQMAVQGSTGVIGTMTFTSTRILATPVPA